MEISLAVGACNDAIIISGNYEQVILSVRRRMMSHHRASGQDEEATRGG